MKFFCSLILSLIVLSACTVVNVNKTNASKFPIKLICIEENPAVQIDDVLPTIDRNIRDRNIRTLIYKNNPPAQCDYTLWYTARRHLSVSPFLSQAEIRVSYRGEVIASASYSHGGGLDLSKWEGTETKLRPVLDELFSQFKPSS